MSKCTVTGDKHIFTHTSNIGSEKNRVGDRQEFIVKTWLTCIACGERRAITGWGELIVKKNGSWTVLEPREERGWKTT